MVLWVESNHQNTIHFFTSPNLKDWTVASQVNDFFECPDLFELPVDGDPGNKKWVLTAASSDYKVGAFDGKTFTPETPKLTGQRGDGYYAAQSYSDIPANDGRRIQIGWLRAASPGMPFNQCMSVPHELGLVQTPDGPRLSYSPVRELESLRDQAKDLGALTLQPGDANPLAVTQSKLVELRAQFEPGTNEIIFNVRGATIRYDGAKQELSVNDRQVPAPLHNGRQTLIVYCDVTSLEVFASDGLIYVPLPFRPKADDLSLGVQAKGGAVPFTSLQIYKLKSAWK
jgi:sucrose-6-phosphate hydrolase SacC (GH32 family)